MMFRPSVILAVALCASPAIAQDEQNLRLVGLDGQPLVGDTNTCAMRGERAVVCGSSNTGRPDLCCDGLKCSMRTGGTLHMRCWTLEDLIQAGEMDAPPPAPTPPVPMPTFPVPPTTFPDGAIDPNNCAGEGGRAQECGASANRAPRCCEGFVCTPGNVKVTCTAASNAAAVEEEQAQAQTCAGDGGRAMECGAALGRPPVCCPGYKCVDGAGVKCVAIAPPTPPPVFGPTLQPTNSPTRDPDFCAGVDERAIDCGAADNGDRPNKCCPGLICRINQGDVNRPICVEPPAGYVWPTASPTPFPTPSPTTPKPTPFPTTYPPTMEFMAATPEPSSVAGESGDPGDVGGAPPSSAFGLEVAYRSAVMGTVGVLLVALLM